MSPSIRTLCNRLELTRAECCRVQKVMILLGAALAGVAVYLSWRSLMGQAGADALSVWDAAQAREELFVAGTIALSGAGALLCGGLAAITLRPTQHKIPNLSPLPQREAVDSAQGTRHVQHAHHAHRAHHSHASHLESSSGQQQRSGWSSLWPADAGMTMPPAGTTAGLPPMQQHDDPSDAAEEPHGLTRFVESATATARLLSSEADELSACSLDLSALANGTLRSVSNADSAARAAHLEVASALLSAARELDVERAGRHEMQSCLIHARLTRQLVCEFLAHAKRVGATATAGPPGQPCASNGLDDEPDLAQLAADCLQAVDRTAELAIESQTHFKAAEAASRARLQAMETLASDLQELSTTSACLLRMTASQVDYGHNIAHLAGRLEMGARCLEDDLQQAFRAE